MENVFPKLETYKRFIMVYLQSYWEEFSLTTFRRVQPNSKEVFYLPW